MTLCTMAAIALGGCLAVFLLAWAIACSRARIANRKREREQRASLERYARAWALEPIPGETNGELQRRIIEQAADVTRPLKELPTWKK